jgi:hypothetical protein
MADSATVDGHTRPQGYPFRPTISKPNEPTIALLVLTDNSEAQLQYQKLWQTYHVLLGQPNNIHVYLLLADGDHLAPQPVTFHEPSRLVTFHSFPESYVPGILQKTLGHLQSDPNEYTWYVRTTAATFLDPTRLITLLKQLPTQKEPLMAGYYGSNQQGKFVQGRFIVFNHAMAEYWKQHASDLSQRTDPDDVVLTQSAVTATHIDVPCPVYTLRSDESTFADRIKDVDPWPENNGNTVAGINMVNNGAVIGHQGPPDRRLDMSLFSYLLYTTYLHPHMAPESAAPPSSLV